jgi:hypothetical protein
MTQIQLRRQSQETVCRAPPLAPKWHIGLCHLSLFASVCMLLSRWASFLLATVPPRSRRKFVGLLIGCMSDRAGWVRRTIGAIRREAHWTTCHKTL